MHFISVMFINHSKITLFVSINKEDCGNFTRRDFFSEINSHWKVLIVRISNYSQDVIVYIPNFKYERFFSLKKFR